MNYLTDYVNEFSSFLFRIDFSNGVFLSIIGLIMFDILLFTIDGLIVARRF